jgi:hypothetical protein
MTSSMMLPQGKSCSDCIHFNRCAWLIACNPNNTICDWSPSKFTQRPLSNVGGK